MSYWKFLSETYRDLALNYPPFYISEIELNIGNSKKWQKSSLPLTYLKDFLSLAG